MNEIETEELRFSKDNQTQTTNETSEKYDFTSNEKHIKQKTQQTISIKSINTETTWRIETEADVDRYVEALKRKLKQSIKEGTVLNIEF